MANKVSVDLPAEVFDANTNVSLIHQVVVAQQAAARQGTHKAKTRSEVSGTGTKPFRQKGTGRARQGSMKAPHMIGGGVVHGPVPRSYGQKTPKKMKAAALRGALSDRARNGRVLVVDALVSGTPSTKAAKEALAGLGGANRNWLVVIDRSDDAAALSTRNLPTVHTLYADQLNTYDVIVSDDVVFTQAGYDAFLAHTDGAGKRINTEEESK
ncbi:50S ribosomal protein L4 [Nesterenkonia cremea]|nr:50S ribosomal protein L4 [Nesterenkonia cremea]